MSLPSGFKKLEYIQSSGTQYIDTGFKPNNNTKVVIDFELTENTGKHQIIFGARSSSSFGQYVLGFTGHRSPAVWRSDFGSNQVTFSSNLTWSGNHNATKNGNICTLDAESVTNTVSTFESTANLFICAGNTGGSVDNYTKAKVYFCKIYDNGTLVRDFIPCKNASGTIGLWDDVNSVFYQNAGSGTFTAGPEVKGTNKALIDGTGYAVKAGKCLVGGTAYAVKKGRILKDGTGYDIKLKTSLTWYLNDNLGYEELAGTKIGFTAYGSHFQYIQAYFGRLYFGQVDFAGSPYDQIPVYYNENWTNAAYRTITFDEEPTGTLLDWLNTHGTNV